jgi:hypothetical protein
MVSMMIAGLSPAHESKMIRFRWSGGTGCATVPASPLRDCDTHSAADGQALTGVLAGYLGFMQRNAVPDEQGK